jgi:hypothetical protein
MRAGDIGTALTPDLVPLPPRFRVDVHKRRLIGLVLNEFLQTRGNVTAAMSRPCVYGVFSGRLGGLRPREELCVGCLRCSVQYPGIVEIRRHPDREALGQGYLAAHEMETVLYETRTGRVPVRGAGYRGRFGGPGWDGMWLDMSEIVRPTRDGIHGREFISTAVDVGSRPRFLTFDRSGDLEGPDPRIISLQVPFFFDAPPDGAYRAPLCQVLAAAAARIGTVSVLPLRRALDQEQSVQTVVPLVTNVEDPALADVPEDLRMVALDGWTADRYDHLAERFPESVVWVRIDAADDVVEPARRGAPVIHLVADYRGRVGGRFILEHIRRAHEELVAEGIREQVTLVGSGGVVMAEHVPKAIACGLDAVGLDVAPWVALQCRLRGSGRSDAELTPPDFPSDWGVQRLCNLAVSWRDQLLEVLGAMGMREVRRLRGELGRVMFQGDVEREAFGEISGYAV